MKWLAFLIQTVLIIFIISTQLAGCSGSDTSSDTSHTVKPIPSLGFSILSTLPHDTSLFTEGLEFYKNSILESAGQYEKSRLVQVDPATGKIQKQLQLHKKYFGEGISVLHDTIYQMTYQEHVVFVYTAADFKKVRELPLTGEGWGMTNDGKSLIVSNGSNNLYFYDPATFKVQKELPVLENGSPALNLNELEYVNGFIYANQWQYNDILKIQPSTGEVVGRIDLGDLVKKVRSDGHSEYLNGIAFNPTTKKFYITGKYWPTLFEIQFDR